MDKIQSEALLESQALRTSFIDRTQVLNKVKALILLPDDMNATVEMAANYYEVKRNTVDLLIADHRQELELDGLRVLKGDDLRDFATVLKTKANDGFISSKTRSFTIIPRRAIFRIGMLLRDSEVAKAVRTKLLDIEEESRMENSLNAEHESLRLKTARAKTAITLLKMLPEGLEKQTYARQALDQLLGNSSNDEMASEKLPIASGANYQTFKVRLKTGRFEDIPVREWNGVRVLSPSDIDKLFDWTRGFTLEKFREMKDGLLPGTHYFEIYSGAVTLAQWEWFEFSTFSSPGFLLTCSGFEKIYSGRSKDPELHQQLIEAYYKGAFEHSIVVDSFI